MINLRDELRENNADGESAVKSEQPNDDVQYPLLIKSDESLENNHNKTVAVLDSDFMLTANEQFVTRNCNTRVYSLWKHRTEAETSSRGFNYFQADEDKLSEYETYHFTQVS